MINILVNFERRHIFIDRESYSVAENNIHRIRNNNKKKNKLNRKQSFKYIS